MVLSWDKKSLKVLAKVMMKSPVHSFHMRLPAFSRYRHVQRLVPLILAAAVVQHSQSANAVTLKTTWVDDTSTPNSNPTGLPSMAPTTRTSASPSALATQAPATTSAGSTSA
jgi:hypothetical protein